MTAALRQGWKYDSDNDMVLGPLPLERPGELEIIAGRAFGHAEECSRLPAVEDGLTPRRALEEAILPAVSASPCGVSFSGGRDSSLVLAIATHLARVHGWGLPVPVTLRFPGHPTTQEADWQRLILDHLGLRDPVILEVTGDSLELTGPVATSVLARHGVLFPANAHLHVPMLEKASGGTLLTGFDGDGLFGTWRWQRRSFVCQGRVRPTPRDGLELVYSALPPTLMRAVARLRSRASSWLTGRGARAVRSAELARWSAEPPSWEERVAWWSRRRYLTLVKNSLEALARDAGSQIRHPLLDGRFLAALGHAGGRAGLGGRGAAMRLLSADLLPEPVLSRTSKALFSTVLFGERTRAFASSAQHLVASDMVDGDELSREWSKPLPHYGSSLLLQRAWLKAIA